MQAEPGKLFIVILPGSLLCDTSLGRAGSGKRQYATINTFFVRLFCILLPFALLGQFNDLNNDITGSLKGYMVWFVIPFSVLISWVYTSLDQVGESTENPFEGSANDVPISQMSRNVEIDIREMLGEIDLPPVLQAQNDIVL
jgi:putative membrane protein